MSRFIISMAVLLCATFLLHGQDPDGSYNPFVNAGTISPSPLFPVEANGSGVINFNFGNTGNDPLQIYTDQYVTLTISLSYGEPNSVNPLDAVGGTAAALFDWTFTDDTYTAIQSAAIPASYSGTITIDYSVTQNSQSPGSNGFNVNITPAPYQTSSNSRDDDAVSSYTYTEIKDFGDAPSSYGVPEHILDFSRFLGAQVDGESGPLPSDLADADDLDNLDDEDGVEFPAEMILGEIIAIPIAVEGLGYLNAWFDWNGDGDFTDLGERVANNIQRLTGTQNLTFEIPADAIIASPTFARFRFSSGTLSSPTGTASGGEVEDYQVTLICKPPAASVQVDNNTICEGDTAIFQAGGGLTYEFRVDGIVAQTGTDSIYMTDSISNGQVVDVIVTDDIGCSAVSDGILMVVQEGPVSMISSSDPNNIICEGTTVTFSAGGGELYDFRIDGASVQDGTSNTYTTSSLFDGNVVDVVVTGSNGCTSVSNGIENTVLDRPVAGLDISDADSTFCESVSVNFTASGGTSYVFRIDGVGVQFGSSDTYTSDTIKDGQVIDVIVRDPNLCADTSSAIWPKVLPPPVAFAGPALSEICQGTSSSGLGGTIEGTAAGGTWTSDVGGSFAPHPDSLNANWTPPAGFTGTAVLTLSTRGGECGVASDSKSLLVQPLPLLSITDPDDVCSPGTVDLSDPLIVQGSDPGLTYTYWHDAEASNPVSDPFAVSDGSYYIKGTNNTTGCFNVAPVSVTVLPSPQQPDVLVIDNCDGTSLLSTNAEGILEWSTGETTSEIVVTTADTFYVAATINGCTSPAGFGISSPNLPPQAPQVSDESPSNVCPDNVVDITAMVISETPPGGIILYKTTNEPLGVDVSDPSAADAGTYYLFYEDENGCFSSAQEINVSITPCPPDVTPTLVVNPNIMHGVTNFDLVVRITELNNIATDGQITVHIPKDPRWTLTDGFVTSLNMLGGTALDNANWTYSEDAVNHIFTTSAPIAGNGFSAIGFRVTFDPGSTRGLYTITTQIVSGAGGELRVSNNVDSERIDYFQE